MASNIDKEKRKKKREKQEKVFLWSGLSLCFIAYLRIVAILNDHPRYSIIDALEHFFSAPLSFHITAGNIMVYAFLVFVIVLFIDMRKTEREIKKHDNPDTVNGEAHLMTLDELSDFQRKMSDPIGKPGIDGPNNMILSKDIRLAIDGYATRRNCNTLVIGGSGAGKSRYYAAPNILQFNTNFVITDPSGELREDYAKALENMGYEILTFDIVDIYSSNRYNPFHYIREEKDVFILVNTLIKNTTPPEAHQGDPIWENGEKLILGALILYLWHTASEEEQTFSNVVKMINMAEVDENDASAKSPLDILFDNLAKEDPENLAVEQYKTFKIAAGKTMKSFLISVGTRLQNFKLKDIAYLTSADDFKFETFADGKKALFVIIPTADDTFNFIVSMLYSQLFATLYNYVETTAKYGYMAKIGEHEIIKVVQAQSRQGSKFAKEELQKFKNNVNAGVKKVWNETKQYYEIRVKNTDELIAWRGTKEAADEFITRLPKMKIIKCARRCPYHVRFILDEFANIGQIGSFSEKLATVRKYELSCAIIIQALSQLKKLYKDDWNSITANCDTKLFLGCDDVETIEWLLKMLGKKTTIVENTSYQANGGGSTSYNHSSLEVLTIDQISMMGDDECLVRIRGKRPYYGKKYDLEKHPNYQYARSLKGQYEIPLTPELKERRDRNRGPLRLRKPDKSILNAQAEESTTPETAPASSMLSKETENNKTERNKIRKESAELAAQEFKETSVREIPPAPELDYASAQNLMEAMGINTDSTEETIKEAVETEVELYQPSFDVIKYGITNL